MISKDLLKILACPDCKASLKEITEYLICININCRRKYPVRNGIPVMLVEESEVIQHAEFQTLMQIQ